MNRQGAAVTGWETIQVHGVRFSHPSSGEHVVECGSREEAEGIVATKKAAPGQSITLVVRTVRIGPWRTQ